MKRCRLILYMLCLVFIMMACGKEDTETKKNDMVYTSENLATAGVKGMVNSFVVWQGRIYMYTIELDDEDEIKQIPHLYSVDLSGNGLEERDLPDVEGKIENLIFLTDNENLEMFLEIQTESEQDRCFYVVDYHSREKKRLENFVQFSSEEAMVRVLKVKQGQIVVATSKRFLVWNEDGTGQTEIKSQEPYIECIARTKDGDIVSTQTDQKKMKISRLNAETWKWESVLTVKNISSVSGGESLIDGRDYDFYYRDDTGIYGYSFEEKKQIKLLDYVASNIQSSYIYSIVPVALDQMVGIAEDGNNGKEKFVLYTKVDPNEVTEKTILVYGAMRLNERVKDAVIQFNRNNPKYEMQYRDYSSYEDPQQQFAVDVATGKVPDIIDLSDVSIKQYVEKGLLENLLPYYQKDEDVHLNDMLSSVVKAMEIKGGYYYISPSFRISTLVGKKKIVNDTERCNLKRLEELAQENQEASLLICNNKEDMLNVLLAYSINDYIDWENGVCKFDGERFKDLLNFCNQGTYLDNDSEQNETEQLRMDKVLLTTASIGAEDVEIYRSVFGEEVSFVGYPGQEEGETYFSFQDVLGMSVQSENKEGVWQFLKMFMMLDYQGQIQDAGLINAGIPTREDAFEMYMKTRTATEDYTDEFGVEISPMKYDWGDGDVEISVTPLTLDEEKQFRNLVSQTHLTGYYEETVMGIVEEESSNYFYGQQSLDKTIQVIQDRVTKYVNENR